MTRLLLDEMLGHTIAVQLCERGHDVTSVVADSELVSRSDEQILAYALGVGRALVTVNIKDFVPLSGTYGTSGKIHGGLILISTKTFPQNRGFDGTIVQALDKLLTENGVRAGEIVFLSR